MFVTMHQMLPVLCSGNDAVPEMDCLVHLQLISVSRRAYDGEWQYCRSM